MPTVLVNNQFFIVEENKILYNELSDKGLDLPHGCLAGSCGACKIEILSGAENLSTPSAVESDTLLHLGACNKTIRLACRAKVLGDVTFTY